VIVYRHATAADYDAILDLFAEVAAEERWIGTESGFDRDAKRAGFARASADGTSTYVIACEEHVVVGSLGAYRTAERGMQIGMMVKASHRGRGIGRGLIDAVVPWARARHEPTLGLLVFPHNVAAIALYRSCGFVETKRHERLVKRRNGEVWDAIEMQRTIDGS